MRILVIGKTSFLLHSIITISLFFVSIKVYKNTIFELPWTCVFCSRESLKSLETSWWSEKFIAVTGKDYFDSLISSWDSLRCRHARTGWEVHHHVRVVPVRRLPRVAFSPSACCRCEFHFIFFLCCQSRHFDVWMKSYILRNWSDDRFEFEQF